MLIMKEQPELIKMAKQEHIASYLGITPSSLSRIKGEYSYALNEQGNIENDFYIMRIVDNKLIVYDKITEQEAIYICHDKSLY